MSNIGSEVADMISKKSSDREYKTSQGAIRIVNSIMGSFNPLAGGTVLQTLAPTVADPVVQAYEEKTYSGKDLMPSQSPFGPQKPDSERYWASVSAPSKVIAKTLSRLTGGDEFEGGVIDISPETLDLMYDHVTGSAGRFLKNIGLATPRAMSEEGLGIAQTPVLRRFAGEQSTYKINSKYRDKKNELELFELRFDNAKTVKERRVLAKDPKYREMRIIKKFDKDIIKLKKKLRAYELAEKKDAVKKLSERIKLLQTKFLQSINKKSMKQ